MAKYKVIKEFVYSYGSLGVHKGADCEGMGSRRLYGNELIDSSDYPQMYLDWLFDNGYIEGYIEEVKEEETYKKIDRLRSKGTAMVTEDDARNLMILIADILEQHEKEIKLLKEKKRNTSEI